MKRKLFFRKQKREYIEFVSTCISWL